MDKVIIWEKTQQILSESLSPTLLKIWFAKVKLQSVLKQGSKVKVILECPNKFLSEQVEKRCGGVLVSALEKVIGGAIDLEFQITGNSHVYLPNHTNGRTEQANIAPNGKGAGVSPYTFEDFVVGDSNRLAYSAALAVTKNPGLVYNPLFIYGGTGLGKTHLLGAIHNRLNKHPRQLKVSYKTTETFTNEFVDALATGQIKLFREKSRGVDVLLIDDVHFLSGKPSTQDEFFHTFNQLYVAHHQIVITSDRHPTEIGKLEDRLVSRFLGGLTVDIGPPELELRMAILNKKAKAAGFELDSVCCEFLANSVTNPREIEGVVAAVTQSLALGNELSLPNLQALFNKHQPQISTNPKQVIKAVGKFYGLKSTEITGGVRKKQLVRARQMVMFLLRTELGFSYSFIGQILGGKDHSTIIHGVEAFKTELAKIPNLKEDLLAIKKSLCF